MPTENANHGILLQVMRFTKLSPPPPPPPRLQKCLKKISTPGRLNRGFTVIAWFVRDIWHKYHSWYFKIVSHFTRLTAREITCNNFEILLVVFMSNITTNHAITYANFSKLGFDPDTVRVIRLGIWMCGMKEKRLYGLHIKTVERKRDNNKRESQ